MNVPPECVRLPELAARRDSEQQVRPKENYHTLRRHAQAPPERKNPAALARRLTASLLRIQRGT
jgi:hypothetical protein